MRDVGVIERELSEALAAQSSCKLSSRLGVKARAIFAQLFAQAFPSAACFQARHAACRNGVSYTIPDAPAHECHWLVSTNRRRDPPPARRRPRQTFSVRSEKPHRLRYQELVAIRGLPVREEGRESAHNEH